MIRYNGPVIASGSPHQPAEKARCCWQHRSRKALGLCGCHWSYATRWIRPMPSSCRGLQTHWAERPTLGWWAPRCWPRSTQTIGCCWRMTRGNWWQDGGDKWALETSWSRARRLRMIVIYLPLFDLISLIKLCRYFSRSLNGENFTQLYMNLQRFITQNADKNSQHQYFCLKEGFLK